MRLLWGPSFLRRWVTVAQMSGGTEAVSTVPTSQPPPPTSPHPPPRPQRRELTLVEKSMAASAGAVVTCVVVNPLDVARVRLQVFDARTASATGGLPMTNTMSALREIVRMDGPRALWRGVTPTLMMSVPATGLYFSLYDALKKRITTLIPNTSPLSQSLVPLYAGASARLLAATITLPFEVLKTNMQARSGKIGISGVLREALAHGGVRSLWTGFGPTILRDIPFSAIYWAGYEHLKIRLQEEFPSSSTWIPFLAGASSGMMAAFITLPVDVIKTRSQSQLQHTHKLNAINLVKVLFKEEGVKGFFRGAGPRLIRVVPMCAITIGCFEFFSKKILASEAPGLLEIGTDEDEEATITSENF